MHLGWPFSFSLSRPSSLALMKPRPRFLCAFVLLATPAWSATSERNTDESKVVPYTLPDLLMTKDGRRVSDAALWQNVRRRELLEDFATSTYGRAPAIPVKLRAEVRATKRDAVDGLATRTLVELRFFDDPNAPKITLMLYVPNA